MCKTIIIFDAGLLHVDLFPSLGKVSDSPADCIRCFRLRQLSQNERNCQNFLKKRIKPDRIFISKKTNYYIIRKKTAVPLVEFVFQGEKTMIPYKEFDFLFNEITIPGLEFDFQTP